MGMGLRQLQHSKEAPKRPPRRPQEGNGGESKLQRCSHCRNTLGLKNTYPAAIRKTAGVLLIAAGYVFFNPIVFLRGELRCGLPACG